MIVKDIKFTEDNVVQVLETIDCYDKSVEVVGYDKKGKEYSAIGYMSCGELVEIEKDTIEEIL